MTVKDVTLHLKSLNSYLLSLGRLYFLKLLLEDSIDQKLRNSQKGFFYIDYSIKLESILIKSLNQKKKTIKWDDNIKSVIQDIISNKNLELLKSLESKLEIKSNSIVHFLISKIENDVLLNPLWGILNDLRLLLEDKSFEDIVSTDIDTLGSSNVERVFFGPSEIKLDKVFDTSYDNLDYTLPENGNTLEEIVPSCWSVSQGELRACELCALSIIEYDNLPLQFYWDFSKQSWDEARHSRIYLNLSLSFFEELKMTLDHDNPLYLIIKSFLENQRGLPLPKDRNTYDAILNAELDERIILLNVLTEGPAVGRLTQKIKKEICVRYPQIKRVLEFDKVDEMFHARIGNYWLKYLIPNIKKRKQRIEDAKLLKGFLLLTSIVEYSGGRIEELAEELAN